MASASWQAWSLEGGGFPTEPRRAVNQLAPQIKAICLSGSLRCFGLALLASPHDDDVEDDARGVSTDDPGQPPFDRS